MLRIPRTAPRRPLAIAAALTGLALAAAHRPGPAADPPARDPAAWGKNHAGKPVPEYVHGDECLFCHRINIGTSWQTDPHARTIRHRNDAPQAQAVLRGQPALAALAPEVEFFLGSRHHLRFLKKDGYANFALLSSRAVLADDGKTAREWVDLAKPAWDRQVFAARCAGCHASGVDASARTFADFSLECYTCHGEVDLQHSNDPARVFLSKQGPRDAKVITSACAQCHLRGGRSRSTGAPYPNNFVAGDNLFQDFEVDFARAADTSLGTADRHIYENVRDVAVRGQEAVTCLSCHQVHGASSEKHRWVKRAEICAECHDDKMATRPRQTVHSGLCGY